MQLRSFDYYSDAETSQAGLTRLATLMREARQQSEARGDVVLTLDNGDSLQGTPMDEQAIRDRTGPHIFYRALDLMQYDAAGLGNHDFNFDLDHLSASLQDAALPVLCANARRLDGGTLPVEPWTVFRKTLHGAPVVIGVFSVVPPQTLVWDADHLRDRIEFDDITETARRAIDALTSHGCDIVIALAHTGLGEVDEKHGQENALWPLSKLDRLDAVVAGHTHRKLPDPTAPAQTDIARGLLNGTPVVMPGSNGTHLGRIDLDLVWTDGRWKVATGQASLRPVVAEEDLELTRIIAPLHHATRTRLSRPVGRIHEPLHSYFGALAPCRAMALLADVQCRTLKSKRLVDPDLPLLSAVAPTRMGGHGGPRNYLDIPAGLLSLRHVFDLCQFPNHLAAVTLTGAQLSDWIEMSAGVYHQIAPGDPGQSLMHPDWPAHGCDLIFGIEYEIDLTRPARFARDGSMTCPSHRRLVSLCYGGRDVAPDDRFTVAVSNYRANGGGNVAALRGATRLPLPKIAVREAVEAYLTASLFPEDPDARPCRFTPIDGTTVILRTGPGAERYLNAIGCNLRANLGLDADGFLNLAIAL